MDADIFVIAIVLLLGGVYFLIFNKLFKVYYFGVKGILSTIFGCLVAAILTLQGILWLIMEHYLWVIGAIVIFLVFMYLAKQGKKTDAENKKAVE